jgi:dCTP deaminase
MLMTDREIRAALESGELEIRDYAEAHIEPTSYDMRLGKEALVSRQDQKILLSPSVSLTLNAGDFALVITYESVKMPNDIAAQIGMKSGLARKGLMLLAGIQIDPGFEGVLVLGLYNASPRRITLDYQAPLCTVEFHRLSGPVQNPHPGHPDLKKGHIPEEDKAFLRTLETESLSELCQSVRTLAQSVSTLTTVTYKIILPTLAVIFAAAVTTIVSAIVSAIF